VTIRGLKPIFDKLVNLSRADGNEYARTGWTDSGIHSNGSLVFGPTIKGSSHWVSPDIKNVPQPLSDKAALPAMVVHTHPGPSERVHFSPEDLETLYRSPRCASLVMLTMSGSGLIAVKTQKTGDAGLNQKMADAGLRTPLPDINAIFEKHKKIQVSDKIALAAAAREVSHHYGLALYSFNAGSSVAVSLYRPD